MKKFNVFFTCEEAKAGDYVPVEADDVRSAEDRGYDYASFHDLHNFCVDAVVPA